MITFERRVVDIVSKSVPDNLCWTTPKEFIEQLTTLLSGVVETGSNEDFMIVGHQEPAVDQRDKVWARFSINRRWLGFYAFLSGAWRKLYHYDSDDIIWKTGNSLSIPDGFELITTSTSSLPPDVRNAIVSQYVETSPGSGVYNYFAVLYVGY